MYVPTQETLDKLLRVKFYPTDGYVFGQSVIFQRLKLSFGHFVSFKVYTLFRVLRYVKMDVLYIIQRDPRKDYNGHWLEITWNYWRK